MNTARERAEIRADGRVCYSWAPTMCCALLALVSCMGCSRAPAGAADNCGEDRLECLKVAYVACMSSPPDRSRVIFVLHNDSSNDCQVHKVQLIRKDAGGAFEAVTSDLLKLTRRRLVPDAWEYGLLSLPHSTTPPDLFLRVEYQSGGTASHAIRKLPEEGFNWSKSLLACEDLSKLFMYFELPSPSAADGVLRCRVNGRVAKASNRAAFALANNRALVGIEIQPENPMKAGDRVFAEISFPDGSVVGGATKAFFPFVLGPTLYEMVLRAVDVAQEGEWLKLALYNESDFLKPPVAIKAVRLDRRDVTTSSRLPSGPLPPDMNYYDRDKRYLFIRCAKADADRHCVEIDFRRMPPLFGQAPSGCGYFDKQTLAFLTQRGVHVAVACEGGPGLPGGACVHYGGLRPAPQLVEVSRSSAETMEACPALPIYLRTGEGKDTKAVNSLADCCDLVLVAQPLIGSSEPPFDRISRFFDYFRKVDENHVPWVASIIAELESPPSPDDMEWLALSSLCSGSHGLQITAPGKAPENLVRSCREKVRAILHDFERLRPFLGIGHRVELPLTCNQGGVRTGCVMCGPDKLLVVAINEWCSKASFRGQEPFLAAPRHGVELKLHLGGSWVAKTAIDPLKGRPVVMSLGDDANLCLLLPPFQIGQVVLLSRSATDSSITRSSAAVTADEQQLARPQIAVASSPIINLRSVRPSSLHPLGISLSSAASQPVTITGATAGSRDSRPGSVDVTATRINSKSTGEVPLLFKAPIEEGQSVTDVQLKSAQLPGLTIPVRISAIVEPLAELQPSMIDFGTLPTGQSSRMEEVRVVSKNADVHIGHVEVYGSIPAQILKAEHERSFRFQVRPADVGTFAFSLDVELRSDNGQEAVHQTVSFVGESLPVVSASPQKVCVASIDRPRKYRVCIHRVGEQNIRLTKITCDGPMEALAPLGQLVRDPWIVLTVRSSIDAGRTAAMTVEGVSEDGNTFSLSVPVVFLGQPETNSKSSPRAESERPGLRGYRERSASQ